MIWNVCEYDCDRAPFFRRDYFHNRPCIMPAPLEANEEAVDDTLGVFVGIPCDP